MADAAVGDVSGRMVLELEFGLHQGWTGRLAAVALVTSDWNWYISIGETCSVSSTVLFMRIICRRHLAPMDNWSSPASEPRPRPWKDLPYGMSHRANSYRPSLPIISAEWNSADGRALYVVHSSGLSVLPVATKDSGQIVIGPPHTLANLRSNESAGVTPDGSVCVATHQGELQIWKSRSNRLRPYRYHPDIATLN